MDRFILESPFQPSGDQPKAIQELLEGVRRKEKYQTLLGVTGSGKTYTISNVIADIQKPTLVISHNKTLAAQLYGEFKQFFPHNAVEYFISYYDFYQPEAYIPSTDKFIDKDFRINDEIDRLRLRTTSSLLSGRQDVIVVSSVSCIYGLGSPEEWKREIITFSVGMEKTRKIAMTELINIHYVRTDIDLTRGKFRVRGNTIDVIPAYEELGFRIEIFDDCIERIILFDPKTGELLNEQHTIVLYPAKQFVTSEENMKRSIIDIQSEMIWRIQMLQNEGKYVEASRLEERTKYDIEMMRELGYCSGIENYSRHIGNRKAGDRPYCLFDYFPKDDFLLIIDESHATIPQLRAMYSGDRKRKTVLVEYGFRLPSALDNRPLKFEEFEGMAPQTIFVSATPADYELQMCEGVVVEQIIRPTGLKDPIISIRPSSHQIDNLIAEIRLRVKKKEKVLVLTLTKKMSEDLSDYLKKLSIRAEYLHSEIKSLERVQILRGLRMDIFDVLVGVNLLREGLDLPEVSLVAIIDADKEGFLRDKRSLFQIAGRAARNINGLVILYADTITQSIKIFTEETERRRNVQETYNQTHGITPQSIHKSDDQIFGSTSVADAQEREDRRKIQVQSINPNEILTNIMKNMTNEDKQEMIEKLEKEMLVAADKTDYEKAAYLRDEIDKIKGSL